MRRNFRIPANLDWRRILQPGLRGRATRIQAALGALVLANVVGLWFVYNPPGGSLEDLEGRITTARKEILARQQSITRLRRTNDKTADARRAGDAFLDQYFLPRQHAYSMLELELGAAARAASINTKDRTFSYEPVEGSDTLGMLTITANFEGTYADLVTFVNQLDRARRLIIIESLQAQPIQGSHTLAITMKLDAFFRFDGAPAGAPEGAPAAVAEVRR
jgi:Tfp pilus assembly protein PilO